MKRILLLPVGILALATLVGCGDKEAAENSKNEKPEPKMAGELEGQSPMDLFPNEVGTQITYETLINGEKSVLTFVVTDVTDGANGKDIVIESRDAAGTVSDTNTWRISDKGIFQVKARTDQLFNPPQPLVNYPITFSETVDYTGKGPLSNVDAMGDIKGQNRVRGKELVQTAMGEIEALAIVTAYQWAHEGITTVAQETTWVAPKYGIVRYQQVSQSQNAEGQSAVNNVSLVMKGYSEKG